MKVFYPYPPAREGLDKELKARKTAPAGRQGKELTMKDEMSLKEFLTEFEVSDSFMDFITSDSLEKWYYGSDGINVVAWRFYVSREDDVIVYDEYLCEPQDLAFNDLIEIAGTDDPDEIAEKLEGGLLVWRDGPEFNGNWISNVIIKISGLI